MQPNYDLSAARGEFPITDEVVYMNHAGIGPLPTVTRKAVEQGLTALSRPFGIERAFGELFAVVRQNVATLINAQPDEIALVQNTAEGMNLAAHSMPLQPGDNVLFCDQEYPAVSYPFMNLEKLRGIEARIMPHDGGGTTVELLERHVDARTRAVAVSSVEFASGFRTGLKAIGEWCKARDIWFVVDGIQSLGVQPMDVKAWHIDFLASGGHKWMLAPMGQGFLYVAQERLEQLRPPFCGAISVANAGNFLDYDLTPASGARRFELGVPNFLGVAGLSASLGLLLSLGIANIDAWTLHLTDMLLQELDRLGYQPTVNRDPARRSAIVLFNAPGESGVTKASERLKAANIVHSVRSGLIRLAPHGYNSEDDICRVAEALGKA